MKAAPKPTGLRLWMTRVLEECDNVSKDFSTDPVHDLRVALRRCRSLADGMIAIDPDPGWNAMKKAGKQLFQRLGALRDVQVMVEWVGKLEPSTENGQESQPAHDEQSRLLAPGVSQQEAGAEVGDSVIESNHEAARRDAVAPGFLAILKQRESEQKQEARAALEEFNKKDWRQWSKVLPQRAARVRPGSGIFKHLALERWIAARELHVRAMRNRSQVALHALRIGIKRFRYIVENFLPEDHKAWGSDLKHMQDLLGEVHDLDVLWATALECRVFPDSEARARWHTKIVEARNDRIAEYREHTSGTASLWNHWRAGLPRATELADLATRRMKLWAKVLDPDFAHSERVARFALQLYDGLAGVRLIETDSSARNSLHAAALLHDVGKSEGEKNHHKRSLNLIQAHGTPLGWDPSDLQRAAIVARFHTGTLPSRDHKKLRDFLPDEQKRVIQLSAILRLANAMDVEHGGRIRKLKIERIIEQVPGRTGGFRMKRAGLTRNAPVVILAGGYAPEGLTAQAIAAERHLLEAVLRRPILVKTMPVAHRKPATVRIAS